MRIVLPKRWSSPIEFLCMYSCMSDLEILLRRLRALDPAVGGALQLKSAIQRFRALEFARRGMDDHSVLHKKMDRLLRVEDQQAALFPRLRQAHKRLAERGQKLIKAHELVLT